MGRAALPSAWSTTSFIAAIRRLPILECLVFVIGHPSNDLPALSIAVCPPGSGPPSQPLHRCQGSRPHRRPTGKSRSLEPRPVFPFPGGPNALFEPRRFPPQRGVFQGCRRRGDRKSTRLNSSHLGISYAVFSWKTTPP